MTTKAITWIAIVGLLASLAACSPGSGSATATSLTPGPVGTFTPVPTPVALNMIITDIAGRLRIAVGSVQFVSVDTASLPQADLGCAAGRPATPGPALPVTVVGQVIQVRAGGVIYVYHARGTAFVYCGPA